MDQPLTRRDAIRISGIGLASMAVGACTIGPAIENDSPQSDRPARQNVFTVDRRPVKMIRTFNGHKDHPNGLAPWWTKPDAVDELVHRLDKYVAAGLQRFALLLPGGHDMASSKMPAAQWHTIPAWKRQALLRALPAWSRQHPHTSLGIYEGFRITRDVRSIKSRESEMRLPDPDRSADARFLDDNWSGWASCGFDAVYLDNAGRPENRRAAVNLFSYYKDRGVRAVGEPMPWDKPPHEQRWVLTDEAFRMPWFSLMRGYRKWGWIDDLSFTCPAGAELGFGISNHGGEPTQAEISSLIRRGFLPYIYADEYLQQTIRLYGPFARRG